MEHKSVLAQVFVPRKFRDVNLQGAALLPTSIVSTAQNSSHWEALRSTLVPHPETAADRNRCCVLRDIPPPIFEADLYHAIKPPAPAGVVDKSPPKKMTRKAVAKAKAATLAKAKEEADAARRAALEPVANLPDYCKMWEELLWAERKRLLILYERYSKYNMAVRRQPDAMRSQAFADIAGIADASPGLVPGDAVLVRTAEKVLLPPHMGRVSIPHVLSGHRMPYGHPQHVELRCTLEHVTRQLHDVGRATGRVHFTWTDDACHVFLESFHPRYPGSRLYSLRFVPSWEPTIACLSALDWLRSLPDRHAHDMFHALLFPTSAPVLPSENRSLLLMQEGETPFMNGTSLNGATESELNPQQREFCRLVERRARHPSYEAIREPLICSGPAGTGKTQTMLHAVHQLLQENADHDQQQQDQQQQHRHNGGGGAPSNPPPRRKQLYRILICTPSHTAADVITLRLGRECKAFLDKSTLFRLYNPNRPVATVPLAVLPYARQTPDTGEFCLPDDARSLLRFRVIVCTCQDAHLLYRVGLTNAQLRVRRRNFEAHLTNACREANLDVSLEGVNDVHWTHLFIDEAAQATEPEALIPLSVVVDPEPGVRKAEICLVGDPRQLSPNVYTSSDGSGGPNDLSRSWMERLLLRPVTALGGGQPHLLGPSLMDMQEWMEYSCRENLSVFLTMNYRGHPSFLMMPSSLFYFDKLQSAYVPHRTIANWCPTLRMVESLSTPVILPFEEATDAASVSPPPEARPMKQYDWPMHFRGVQGRDQTITVSEGFTSQSWTNEDEARIVTEIVQTLVAEGVPLASVGVMSPFRGQVVRIREWLRRAQLSAINVGTIEDYQSVERDVIVLSLTRATPDFVPNDVASRVGVFGQPKRSNVALTRAEHLFIVVGNPVVMVQDPIWKQFLHFCLRNGMFYGDPCGTLPQLAWNESRRTVRCRPERTAPSSGDPSEEVVDDDDEDVVVISTLEHNLRRAAAAPPRSQAAALPGRCDEGPSLLVSAFDDALTFGTST